MCETGLRFLSNLSLCVRVCVRACVCLCYSVTSGSQTVTVTFTLYAENGAQTVHFNSPADYQGVCICV